MGNIEWLNPGVFEGVVLKSSGDTTAAHEKVVMTTIGVLTPESTPVTAHHCPDQFYATFLLCPLHGLSHFSRSICLARSTEV
jgi:hypothetical protein